MKPRTTKKNMLKQNCWEPQQLPTSAAQTSVVGYSTKNNTAVFFLCFFFFSSNVYCLFLSLFAKNKSLGIQSFP